LEPHRKKVHDGEITKCNQEVAHSDEDRDFLFEKKGCENGFNGNPQFNDDEQEEKHDGDDEGRDDPRVTPLFGLRKITGKNGYHSPEVAHYSDNSRTVKWKKPGPPR
jgi:hypothetical protein